MNIVEDVASDIKIGIDRLKRLRETKKILLAMPPEIRELEGFVYAVQTTDDESILPITTYSGEETLRSLKTIGFMGFKRHNNGYSKDWYAAGEAIINGVRVKITVYYVDQPEQCHLEPYYDTITKYKVICEDELSDGVVL